MPCLVCGRKCIAESKFPNDQQDTNYPKKCGLTALYWVQMHVIRFQKKPKNVHSYFEKRKKYMRVVDADEPQDPSRLCKLASSRQQVHSSPSRVCSVHDSTKLQSQEESKRCLYTDDIQPRRWLELNLTSNWSRPSVIHCNTLTAKTSPPRYQRREINEQGRCDCCSCCHFVVPR